MRVQKLLKPTFINHFFRNASSTKTSKPVLLHENSTNVPTFGGSLWVMSEVNVNVKSLGPHEYPNLDTAFLKVTGTEQEQKLKTDFTSKLDGNRFKFNGVIKNGVRAEEVRTVTADIRIPCVHSMHLDVSGDGNIEVSDFVETDFCHIKSENGVITASGIKTKDLTIHSTGKGDIHCCGVIQGNIKIISGGTGNVTCEKRFSGPLLDISVEHGDVRVAACYSESSKFAINYGNLYLRNVHNESYIAVYEQGDVKIQGMDGSTNIFVKRGDVDCHISTIRHESRIHAEDGDIVVKLSDTYPLKISIHAVEVIPDIKFAGHGSTTKKDDGLIHYYATIQPDKFSPTLEIIAENGRVVLESQDWAASLGLKMPIDNITRLG